MAMDIYHPQQQQTFHFTRSPHTATTSVQSQQQQLGNSRNMYNTNHPSQLTLPQVTPGSQPHSLIHPSPSSSFHPLHHHQQQQAPIQAQTPQQQQHHHSMTGLSTSAPNNSSPFWSALAPLSDPAMQHSHVQALPQSASSSRGTWVWPLTSPRREEEEAKVRWVQDGVPIGSGIGVASVRGYGASMSDGLVDLSNEEKRTRRKEQNRLAQQDLRRRRMEHTLNLENKVDKLSGVLGRKDEQIGLLEDMIRRLQAESIPFNGQNQGQGQVNRQNGQVDLNGAVGVGGGKLRSRVKAVGKERLGMDEEECSMVPLYPSALSASLGPHSAGLHSHIQQQQQQQLKAIIGNGTRPSPTTNSVSPSIDPQKYPTLYAQNPGMAVYTRQDQAPVDVYGRPSTYRQADESDWAGTIARRQSGPTNDSTGTGGSENGFRVELGKYGPSPGIQMRGTGGEGGVYQAGNRYMTTTTTGFKTPETMERESERSSSRTMQQRGPVDVPSTVQGGRELSKSIGSVTSVLPSLSDMEDQVGSFGERGERFLYPSTTSGFAQQ